MRRHRDHMPLYEAELRIVFVNVILPLPVRQSAADIELPAAEFNAARAVHDFRHMVFAGQLKLRIVNADEIA